MPLSLLRMFKSSKMGKASPETKPIGSRYSVPSYPRPVFRLHSSLDTPLPDASSSSSISIRLEAGGGRRPQIAVGDMTPLPTT